MLVVRALFCFISPYIYIYSTAATVRLVLAFNYCSGMAEERLLPNHQEGPQNSPLWAPIWGPTLRELGVYKSSHLQKISKEDIRRL